MQDFAKVLVKASTIVGSVEYPGSILASEISRSEHQNWEFCTSRRPRYRQPYSAEVDDDSDEVEQLEAAISVAVESLREAIVVIHRLLPEGAARTDILTGVEGALAVLSES